MAAGDSSATLESCLNQATNPNNQEDRWDCIQGFYQLVNQETDGPQVAVRLLAHKIQSPQEKEALQALTVLEACMNNCGEKFHREAAKFRFLNELIKLLTPKYFGAWTPQTVKDRVTEVLYGWTLWLKDEPKILEAYKMLKKQGIVKKDPKLPDTIIMAPPPQRNTDSVFDQEDKAQLLARLLKSTRPEDLQTANRLIKSTIQEEQEKAEKMLKRESTLKEAESSTKQLRELLKQHSVTGKSATPSDDVKAVYEHCDRLRPSLFRLASETMEDDAALAQILEINDELTLAVNAYKNQVGSRECNGGTEGTPTSPREIKSYHLIDLSVLDSPKSRKKADSPPSFQSSFSPFLPSNLFNIPYVFLYMFSKLSLFFQLNEGIQMRNGDQSGGTGLLLRARGCGRSSTTSNGTNAETTCVWFPVVQDCSVTNALFTSWSVVVGQLEPITLYDQGGVHVSLHFAKDSPPGHPDVAVVVISTVNTSALDVKDLVLQAAVPKTMLVKLQPASGTHLPPYNPLLPPPATSQVLLLANPQKRKVRLRYKLTLTHGDQQLNETGEIENFPDWTSLIGH
uniref:ADP-ribosylation factor-binding protein GGA3-like n=1 Tax=Echeneis naucrates TaxID=173247 RepID=A0A665THG3_ECHNA